MTDQSSAKDDPDIALCVQFLSDLGDTCSFASKGKDLIEELLETLRKDEDPHPFDLDLQSLWEDSGSHMTNLYLSDGNLESFWGTF
jgi:hypothetical protein